MGYTLREATLDDADALVRHRVAMFADMGIAFDHAPLAASFREWLNDTMPSGTYRAWLAESDGGDIACGGGISILPWPPGPQYPRDRPAFVYNIDTEAAHRPR